MSQGYEFRPRGVFDIEAQKVIFAGDDAWVVYHAWLDAGGALQPDSTPVVVVTLEETLATRIQQVEEIATKTRRHVTGFASAQEMSSWTLKYTEAAAYTADPTAPAPMLQEEANAREIPLADIAARVMTNARAYSGAEAYIAGVSGFHRDRLRALGTVEEVLAYDITTRWDPAADAALALTKGAARATLGT